MIIIFVLSMVYLLVTIIKFKMNPFFSMITASLLVGVAVGMDLPVVVSSVTGGFGNVLGSLGIVVALGALLGALLAEAGATDSLANGMLNVVGDKKAPLAMNLTGFVISIPVYMGSAYIILNPLLRVLSRKTKKQVQTYITALVVGLLVTHCLVIPTPGPLAVSSTLGLNVGWFILYAVIISLPASLLGGWIYGEFIGKYCENPEYNEADTYVQTDDKGAPAGLAFGIIALPIVIILLGTIIPMVITAAPVVSFCSFLTAGSGVVALLISVVVAIITLKPYINKPLSAMIKKTFDEQGEMFLILGAGGSFGAIISASGIGDYIVSVLSSANISVLILAFVLCLLLKASLGSSAVALVTTASILGPIAAQLGAQPILLGLAICAGGLGLPLPTDGAFWLVQKLDNLSVKDTFLTYTVGSTIACAVAFGLVMILNIFAGVLPGLAM